MSTLTLEPRKAARGDAMPSAGRALRAFHCAYHGTLLVFTSGQRVTVDAPLARYMIANEMPVEWERAA